MPSPAPTVPRLAGVSAQGVDNRGVEHLGLGRGQCGSHLEHMSDRRLLEIAHGRVEMIDRRLDLGGVAVAGGDGGGQFAIGGADLGLQRRTARGEAGFDDVETAILIIKGDPVGCFMGENSPLMYLGSDKKSVAPHEGG